MTKCCYCGREWKERDECCASCGAPNRQAKIDYYYPFFYDGYIIYPMRRYEIDCEEWRFYKGITYMGKIRISRDWVRSKSPAYDFTPEIIEAFNNKVDTL